LPFNYSVPIYSLVGIVEELLKWEDVTRIAL